MSRYSSAVRRVVVTVLAAGGGALAACGDSRVKDLTAGISRDSALVIMGRTPAAGDSLTNVHERGVYLVKGQMIEVLMFARDGDAHTGQTIPEQELTPVVLVDDALMGWGWTYWDSVATEHRIPRHPQ